MYAPSTPLAVSRLPLSARLADYSILALSILLGVGSIVLFAWPGRPVFVNMGLSPGGALWWNAVVSVVFFAQHSIMVRRSVRVRLAAVVPQRYDRAFYAITSGLALIVVVVLLQPDAGPLFVLQGLPRMVVTLAALAAVAGFAWGIHALRSFDLLGLRPIREHLRDKPADSHAAAAEPNALVVRGPYRWVRHPLYTCVIVLLWADPQMGPGRLVLAGLWTAWIYVGARLEERDLIADFGDEYREYRKRVPILIPWRGKAT